MFKWIAGLLLVLSTQLYAAPDAAEILRHADAYRLAPESALVATKVERYENNSLKESRLYHVFLKSGRRSLVLMKSPEELGQKVLMLDDKYWLIMPSSKRPIRITPTQKLLGEASTGDIATMTWGEDYAGTILGNETIGGVPLIKLELKSSREGTTYDKIVLWVTTEKHEPYQAELYLTSGKMAKTAKYEMGFISNLPTVVKTVMEDKIQTNRSTALVVESITAKDIPDKIYNPAYLLQESPED